MSSLQTVNSIEDEILYSLICPIVIRLGIRTIPAASPLVGEVALSYLLHYGVILLPTIGIELMEFPVKMIYILESKRIMTWKLSAIRLRYSAR
jgi:hypothetical protein